MATTLNEGILALRQALSMVGPLAGAKLVKEQPPDAITFSLGDGSVWTATAFRQKPGTKFYGGYLDEAAG